MEELEQALNSEPENEEPEDDSSSSPVAGEEGTEPESSGEAEDPKAELERLKAQLAERESALEKINRDYSSLRGQLKPQLERDAEFRDEIAAIHKSMALVTKALVSSGSDELAEEYQQVNQDLSQAKQARSLEKFYDDAVEEVKEAIKDAEGNVLLDLEGDDENLSKVKALWKAGQSGRDGDKNLSVDERINKISQAVGEIHKLARSEERKRLREANEQAKTARKQARKQEREQSGEMDLDTGTAAGSGANLDGLSAQELIEVGLKRAKETGKRSTLFANSKR